MRRVVKITNELGDFVSFAIHFLDCCIVSPCNYSGVSNFYMEGTKLSLDRNDCYLLYFNYTASAPLDSNQSDFTKADETLFISDKHVPININPVPYRLPCNKKIAYRIRHPDHFNAFRPLFNGMPVYNSKKKFIGICAFPSLWDSIIITDFEPLPVIFKPLKIMIPYPYTFIYNQKQELIYVFLGRTMIFRKYYPHKYIHELNECNVLNSDSNFNILKFQDGREEILNQITIVEYFKPKDIPIPEKPPSTPHILGNTRFLQSVDSKRWLCISTC